MGTGGSFTIRTFTKAIGAAHCMDGMPTGWPLELIRLIRERGDEDLAGLVGLCTVYEEAAVRYVERVPILRGADGADTWLRPGDFVEYPGSLLAGARYVEDGWEDLGDCAYAYEVDLSAVRPTLRITGGAELTVPLGTLRTLPETACVELFARAEFDGFLDGDPYTNPTAHDPAATRARFEAMVARVVAEYRAEMPPETTPPEA